MSALQRKSTADFSRPLVCRQCSESLGRGSEVLIDPDHPWLAFHEDCLRELVPERVVSIYDSLPEEGEIRYDLEQRALKELDTLQQEVEALRARLKGDAPGILAWRAPGIRQVPVSEILNQSRRR